MFHFSHSKIIESFIDVSVIYELSVLAGNLPVWLFAERNGHSTETDISSAEPKLFLPWVKALNRWGTWVFPPHSTELVTRCFFTAMSDEKWVSHSLLVGTQKFDIIPIFHRITESLRLERPLRSSSPSTNPTQPCPLTTSSVPHPHSSGTPPGMVIPPSPWAACSNVAPTL